MSKSIPIFHHCLWGMRIAGKSDFKILIGYMLWLLHHRQDEPSADLAAMRNIFMGEGKFPLSFFHSYML